MGMLRRSPGERVEAADGSSATRSVYEQRYAEAGREEDWEPVGEIDPASGEWVAVEGWENRVRGWMPLGEFLEQRR